MIFYIFKRLIWSICIVIIITFITFIVFYLLPTADPALLRAGRAPTPALIAAITKQFGLDKPFYVQYWTYFKQLFFHANFGYSYTNDESVGAAIGRGAPASAFLAIGAAVIWLASGIPIGIISAVKRGSLLDRVLMVLALVAISCPVYWLGLLVIYILSVYSVVGSYEPLWQNPWIWFKSLILAWIVLATAFTAFYARFMRSSLSEILGEDYIRTARAKGLSGRRVVFRHGVRAAITPVVTIFGIDLGTLLGGVILVESVFNIPGIGRLAFNAIENADLPTIQGTVFVGAAAIVFLNLLVDIGYAFIDPRIRYH